MEHKYSGAWSGVCLVFIILAGIVTLFYYHRVDSNKYKFNSTYYVHDNGIGDYSQSSLVSFPIKGNYSDLVGKDVYYYDGNLLKKDNLIDISLSTKKFTVSNGEHDISNFLGKPSGGIPLVGSILAFLTGKTVFIYAVVIPGILCIIYEL